MFVFSKKGLSNIILTFVFLTPHYKTINESTTKTKTKTRGSAFWTCGLSNFIRSNRTIPKEKKKEKIKSSFKLTRQFQRPKVTHLAKFKILKAQLFEND